MVIDVAICWYLVYAIMLEVAKIDDVNLFMSIGR